MTQHDARVRCAGGGGVSALMPQLTAYDERVLAAVQRPRRAMDVAREFTPPPYAPWWLAAGAQMRHGRQVSARSSTSSARCAGSSTSGSCGAAGMAGGGRYAAPSTATRGEAA